MFTKLRAMLPGTADVSATADRSNWSDEQWKDHLLAQATSQAEKAEIYAIFARS